MKFNRKKRRIVRLFFVWIIIQTGVVFPANTGDIIITEFFYNKSLPDNYLKLPEYVELFNNTDSSIDLFGWKVDIDGNVFEIDLHFIVKSHDYAVILGYSGKLRSEDEITYCSSFHYGIPFNVCDMPIDNLFWKIGTFSDLSNTSGSIKIWDNSDSQNIIDSVLYNMDTNFPVSNDILGRAAVFIIDPKSENTHVKNDNGLNWRSSEHNSDYLWNGSSSDFGSPMSSNFITPTISIRENSTANSDSTKNTVCTYEDSIMICHPQSDGYPGGYAAIVLSDSTLYFDSSSVSTDFFLYWEINKNILLIDNSEVDSLWHPIPLLQDTNLTSSVYIVPLITRSTDGLWGKTDTTIYINQEINFPPVIEKINGQTPQSVINIFENSDTSLYAIVTDLELCSSINTPCNFDSLTFKSSFFDNSSPFIWTSIHSDLLSRTDILNPNFTTPQIDSYNDISANYLTEILDFQFQATDPFGKIDYDSIRVIVHNKNQKPEISLNLGNINGIDFIAGYSNKFSIEGNKIELYELDASGVHIDTTIIGQISDIDNDLNFKIIPLGSSCDLGFENNYCLLGTTIKTDHNIFYDYLEIPFVVDDEVPTPIEGFISESTSDTSYLVVQNIKNITHTVAFDDSIIVFDEIFHLPEDSTLITEIPFHIDFKLDGNNTHEINLDSLQWSFQKLDTENKQRVFAYKTADGFFIDSLFNNFNGETGLKVAITDNDNSANSLSDSIIINIPIFIDQRNDTLKQFYLYHDIKNYSLDVSTIDTVRDIRYFRLAQSLSDNSASNPTPKKLRFEWEKNDELDIDTDIGINKDLRQNIYYRLELIDTLTHIVSVLQDSLPHNNFTEFEKIWTEISFEEAEFPSYYDSLGYTSTLETQMIDINGLSTYRWRVVAKNYWRDDLGGDPMELSQDWRLTDFRLDLIQPEVSNMDIILNDMYPGYYDLLWSSSEAFLTDSTFLSINEEINQFSAISMLNPRKVTDNLFHFTGLIPTDLTSVTITFDLQVRDNAMNSGKQIDKISYVKVSPDSVSRLISPSDNVSITLSKYSVSEPVQIIITEENDNIISRESEFELNQISPTIHFYPKQLILNNSASITFNMSDYISSAFDIGQLVIVQIIDNEPIQLSTNISGYFITANIDALGDYAVFLNSTLEKPLPSAFEIKMNYPNPFNPSTTIPIELPKESYVKIAIYNILGEKIAILSEGIKSSGYHNILWNGTNQLGQPVSSGIYFVSVHFGQKNYHQKIMLLK